MHDDLSGRLQEIAAKQTAHPAHPARFTVENLRKRLETDHKQATMEATELRQRLHEVELIRTGCQAALAAMEQEDQEKANPHLSADDAERIRKFEVPE